MKPESKKIPKKSAAPVWAKPGKSPSSAADAKLCIAYCAGRDVAPRPMADEVMIPYDIWLNRSHCAMLCREKIIKSKQLASIARALTKIEKDWKSGAFHLDPALEDVHINIERAVARIAGESAAGVMHTARSRNDQTTTDVRLYLRDELIRAVEAISTTIRELARCAGAEAETVMSGWTHGQPAMPTTLGHWAAAHACALARDAEALRAAWPFINQCPLGAAAGFGTSWPIDRALVAEWLGFDGPQRNSLDCVSTRWECEARLGFALSMMMTHLSSLGQDLYFLSSPPRRLIELDSAFTTGSSIMPQKRNPDFAEVTRARAAAVQSLVGAISASGRGALSGYNRDSQWTKYWILDLVDEVGAAPTVFARVIATMRPDRDALALTASGEFISAVDLADHLASTRSIEFRRLYHLIGEAVTKDRETSRFRLETLNNLLKRERIAPGLTNEELVNITDPASAIKNRASAGGPSPKDTIQQARALIQLAEGGQNWVAKRRADLLGANQKLNEAITNLCKMKE